MDCAEVGEHHKKREAKRTRLGLAFIQGRLQCTNHLFKINIIQKGKRPIVEEEKSLLAKLLIQYARVDLDWAMHIFTI
jgi:hypothetical protein